MFDIEYKGGNTVVISARKSQLITDPKQSVVGLKDADTKGSIELATEARLAIDSATSILAIEGPGEYEIADFSIRGVSARRHIDGAETEPLATIYRIEVGDVRIGLLGNIDEHLSEDQLEALGVVDVLIIPVGGGGYTLDPVAAVALTRRIDPKAVIPVHYADPALKYEVPQEPLDVFVKDLAAPVETVSKYKVKSAVSIPPVLTVIEITRS